MAIQINESLKTPIFVVNTSILPNSVIPSRVTGKIAYSTLDKRLYIFNGTIWEVLLQNDLSNYYTKSEIDLILSSFDLDTVIENTSTVKQSNVSRIHQLLNIATPESVNVVSYQNEHDSANGIVIAQTKTIKYYSLQANTPKTVTLGPDVSDIKLVSGTNVVNVVIDANDGNAIIETITGRNIFTLESISGELLVISSAESGTAEISYIS